MNEELRGMVAKWRSRASREDENGEKYETEGSATRLRLCADELEALLSQPEAAGALAGEGAAAYDSWASIVEDMRDAENRKETQRPPLSYWRARVAALSAAPVAAQEDDAADVSVWTLCDLMEKAGAVRDEGEEGSFWTITLDGIYALEGRLRAANISPGWVGCAPAQQPAVAGDAIFTDEEVDEALEVLRGRHGSTELHGEVLDAMEATLRAALAPAATPVPVGGEGEVCKRGKVVGWWNCRCEQCVSEVIVRAASTYAQQGPVVDEAKTR